MRPTGPQSDSSDRPSRREIKGDLARTTTQEAVAAELGRISRIAVAASNRLGRDDLGDISAKTLSRLLEDCVLLRRSLEQFVAGALGGGRKGRP